MMYVSLKMLERIERRLGETTPPQETSEEETPLLSDYPIIELTREALQGIREGTG